MLRLATFALLCALSNSSTALALDCTPLATVPNTGTTVYGQFGTDAIAGELACGTDYAGWDFYVYEFTIASDSEQLVHVAASGGFDPNAVVGTTHVLLFPTCDPTECLFAGPFNGTSTVLCMPAGTYTLIVANTGYSGTINYNVGTASVNPCAPVDAQGTTWGTVKARY